MSLKSRVFDCFPARQFGLVKLLRLVDVVETDQVPSAAVECSATPRLLMNPAFAERHANTPEKLFVLVLHELYHVLLGHTQRLKPITPADNFVFDCVINALICRQFPDSRYTGLFTDLYHQDLFPACFLRPPSKWDPDKPALLPSVLKCNFNGAEEARRIYRSLYSKEGATYADLYELLPKLIIKLSKPEKGLSRSKVLKVEDINLLGGHVKDHGTDAPNLQDPYAEQLLQSELKEAARGWPKVPQPLKGRGFGDFIRETTIQVNPSTVNRALLTRLITSVAESGRVLSDSLRISQAIVQIQTHVRPQSVSRRDLVQQALGFTPPLFDGQTVGLNRHHNISPVHVYLDVSGSVESVLDSLYGAVLSAGDLVHPKIHLFSTEVRDIRFSELRAGKVHSTRGTSIACVIQHIKANRVRNALLVTDGGVGLLNDAESRLLSNMHLAVAYTPSHCKQSLAKVTRCSGVLHAPHRYG